MKKKALLSSILTIALCLSLIAGSTFALFTSESKVNVAVTAGKVDVKATIVDITPYSPTSISANGNVIDATDASNHDTLTFKNGGTALFTGGNTLQLNRITPGDRVTAYIELTNNSNVSIQYRTIIKSGEGDNALLSGLKVTFGEGESAQSFTGNTIKSEWTAVAPEADVQNIKVTIELPTTAGNEYQEKSCNLIFTVEAVQGNAEMPDEWDGVTTTAPTKDNENVYHITNAAELVYAMEHSTPTMIGYNGSEYAFGKYVLDKDIDLGGATVPGFADNGSNNFQGSFDGQGHTISNFTINNSSQEYYAGLFGYLYGATVKNVNVSGATVIGQKQVGVIVGAASDNSTVTNCNVYNSTVIGTKKVGVVAGYTLYSTVTNCHVENCVVYCADADATESGAIIGYENTAGTTATNNTSSYVTVNTNVSFVWTDDATVLTNALKENKKEINITLTGDVEVAVDSGTQWTNAFGGTDTETVTIDGQGKYTLTFKHIDSDANHVATNGAELVLKGLKLTNSGYNDGPWNRHDIVFDCKVTLENVTSDTAIALGDTATMKNVTINETGDVYALWIKASVSTVELDNVTINCPNGRAIAIKDEYVAGSNRVSVQLNIKDSKIVSAKKAAILVTNTAGATITASNVDITEVAADSTNLVWIDNARSTAIVNINGATSIVEP